MAEREILIQEEIEALQAIMMDEVNVITDQRCQPCGLEVTIVPATGQNIDEQHVKVTLVVDLPPEYPDISPDITLRNPRGIDDYILENVRLAIAKKCEDYIGCPVIYEIIELVRENLTANNVPSCPCAICLCHFTEKDEFTKTDCFHYFHSFCLGRYVMSCEEELVAQKEEPQPAWMTKEDQNILCPVCREVIHQQLDASLLLESLPSEESELFSEFDATDPNLVLLQQKMSALYLQQKEKGGIIDLEEEKNKFLISSETAVNEQHLMGSSSKARRGQSRPQKHRGAASGRLPPWKNPAYKAKNTQKQVNYSGDIHSGGSRTSRDCSSGIKSGSNGVLQFGPSRRADGARQLRGRGQPRNTHLSSNGPQFGGSRGSRLPQTNTAPSALHLETNKDGSS